LLLPFADILESIFAAAPPPAPGQSLTEAASGSDLLQAALANNSPSAAAAAAALQQQAQGQLAGLQGAAAAAAGLGVSAADVESLVSLAAKQAAKEEELAAARTQVGGAVVCFLGPNWHVLL
jgi:hypothetical protein